jgi:hypothetical protein
MGVEQKQQYLLLFEKHYDVHKYHCVHFVIDAAKYLFNKDYSKNFIGLTASLNDAIQTSRKTVIRNKHIKEPENGCIVLMTSLTGSNHVGLFYGGKVLHLNETGVQYVALRSLRLQYPRFRFYEPVTHL